jgi:hypothetical protein
LDLGFSGVTSDGYFGFSLVGGHSGSARSHESCQQNAIGATCALSFF